MGIVAATAGFLSFQRTFVNSWLMIIPMPYRGKFTTPANSMLVYRRFGFNLIMFCRIATAVAVTPTMSSSLVHSAILANMGSPYANLVYPIRASAIQFPQHGTDWSGSGPR